MAEIYCVKENGYKWFKKDNVYFRGYIVKDDSKGQIFRGEDAINLLNQIESYDEFDRFLGSSDGLFSIIIEKNNVVWIAVDIARSMPLYFSADGSIVSDSSEYIRKTMNIDRSNINQLRAVEMLATEFVAHNNTMYDSIKQLNIGQSAKIFNEKIDINSYFNHFTETKMISYEEAMRLLAATANKMIDDLIRVVNNRPIILSLSGGYDSRFIACLLRSHGIKDVLCYSYGKETSPDVIQSKKVAKALGYQWVFVPYTEEKIRNILNEDNESYFELCNEHDFTIYLINYVAVKHLHETNIIKPNSVFITGLCHDMPTGAYVKNKEEIGNLDESIDGVAKYIIGDRFLRYKLKQETRNIFEDEVKQYIENKGLVISDYQDFVRVVDALQTSYDHSRRFLPMNKIHGYFGYEWLLPCWNKNLLLFWYSVPYTYRVKQKLYEDWLINDLCIKFNLGTKKINYVHAVNPLIAQYKRKIGGLIAMIIYNLGLPIKRKTDINNFSQLEVLLFKKIKQKKIIDWQRAAYTLLLTIYVMEHRYGPTCLKNIKKFIY